MRAIKRILAVLLFIALLPTSGCTFSESVSCGLVINELESKSASSFTLVDRPRVPLIREKLDDIAASLVFLVIVNFVLVLSAGIISIMWSGKFYGAFTAGALVLIPYLWNASLQSSIREIANDSVLGAIDYSAGGNSLGFANLLLFLPMTLLLIIGCVDIIRHFTKKEENAPGPKVLMDDISPVGTIQMPAPSNANANFDDMKRYKELLDIGAISQEEYDAKKKQLLGL